MRATHVVLLALAALASVAASADSANIVAVHGLLGFGPSELLGVGYWGFWNIPLTVRTNYITLLQDYQWGWSCGCVLGHCLVYCQTPRNNVIYAQVGPVSSNWDRACELYAQLTGTLTDYGYYHSKQYGHSRYGPDYRKAGALLPGWSASNPASFVGHSMGGQTIRWLEDLLMNGAPSERVAYPAGQAAASPLFTQTGRAWIKSIHTISAVHNGSPLYTALGRSLVDVVKNLLVNIAGQISNIPLLGVASWGYDFMLGQFGITMEGYNAGASGGNFQSYLNAVFNPNLPIWSPTFTDLASYDMGPQAVAAFNARAAYTYPNTYYFSHATSRTSPCSSNSRYQCGNGMEFFLVPFGNIIGSISGNSLACTTYITCTSSDHWCQAGAGSSPTPFCYDWSYQENDGLVPWKSSVSPSLGVSASQYHAPLHSASYANNWAKGTWYYTNHTGHGDSGNGRDHVQIIGLDTNALFTETGADTGSYNTYTVIAQEVAYAWSH